MQSLGLNFQVPMCPTVDPALPVTVPIERAGEARGPHMLISKSARKDPAELVVGRGNHLSGQASDAPSPMHVQSALFTSLTRTQMIELRGCGPFRLCRGGGPTPEILAEEPRALRY